MGEKPSQSKFLELVILVVIACVIARGVYIMLNWKDAGEIIAGMGGDEWVIAVILVPLFVWWYSKK